MPDSRSVPIPRELVDHAMQVVGATSLYQFSKLVAGGAMHNIYKKQTGSPRTLAKIKAVIAGEKIEPENKEPRRRRRKRRASQLPAVVHLQEHQPHSAADGGVILMIKVAHTDAAPVRALLAACGYEFQQVKH